MKLGVLVNAVENIRPEQTTTSLAHRARLRGHEVSLFGVAELGLSLNGAPIALARHAPRRADAADFLAGTLQSSRAAMELEGLDAILIRTNPGRGGRPGLHAAAMQILRLTRERGVPVWNDPDGLIRAGNKLYLSRVPPEWRPETLISASPEMLRAFVLGRDAPSVLKPLDGTQGRDVYRLDPARPDNLRAIIASLTRGGQVVAQAYVPEAPAGDVRVILIDGAPLTVNGQVAAVRRRPASGEFRSNVSLGGTAEPAALPERWGALFERLGPQLVADRIRVAGLDMVGDKVVEINVFSPGGLHDAERFYGADFVDALLDRLLNP